MQTFLTSPKFDKTYLYKNPTHLYHEFCNAWAYHKIVELSNPNPPKQQLMEQANTMWTEVKGKNTNEIKNSITNFLNTPVPLIGNRFQVLNFRPVRHTIPRPVQVRSELNKENQIAPNAISQHSAISKKECAQKNVVEYTTMLDITTDSSMRKHLMHQINTEKQIIIQQDKRLTHLKRHAAAQGKLRERKRQLLENNIVEKYDSPGRPSYSLKNPELYDQLHACVEFGSADNRRRKEWIKVRTISHLRTAMEENYNQYISKSCFQTYLLPRHPNSIQAKRHHHPAFIRNVAVSRNEMTPHEDEHYCLASVKGVRQFAEAFSENSIIISQDDKAKVPLGIPAVGCTFSTVQSRNQPVSIPDHDFPVSSKHKLIPSVYLIIDPTDTNESMRSGHLAVFVRPELWFSTTASSHMFDLHKIQHLQDFQTSFLDSNNMHRPIVILLVDGGPDENPRHLKNIKQYCQYFRDADLDYMTIRTHAPGQSAYNPVERSMASLSGKLAGITLPHNKYGNHLRNGKVVNDNLACQNFAYSGEMLCELWKKDHINGHSVHAEYISENNIEIKTPVSWLWIETHTQICRYSLDIRKCNNLQCCKPKRCETAATLLAQNNGFLPPVSKGRDNHFLNPIHILEYFDLLKIPKYDQHCPSISSELHQRLCCNLCGKYFPTLSFVAEHKKTVHIQHHQNSSYVRNSRTFEDISNNYPFKEFVLDFRNVLSDHE